jgi:hypothetical protein
MSSGNFRSSETGDRGEHELAIGQADSGGE